MRTVAEHHAGSRRSCTGIKLACSRCLLGWAHGVHLQDQSCALMILVAEHSLCLGCVRVVPQAHRSASGLLFGSAIGPCPLLRSIAHLCVSLAITLILRPRGTPCVHFSCFVTCVEKLEAPRSLAIQQGRLQRCVSAQNCRSLFSLHRILSDVSCTGALDIKPLSHCRNFNMNHHIK